LPGEINVEVTDDDVRHIRIEQRKDGIGEHAAQLDIACIGRLVDGDQIGARCLEQDDFDALSGAASCGILVLKSAKESQLK